MVIAFLAEQILPNQFFPALVRVPLDGLPALRHIRKSNGGSSNPNTVVSALHFVPQRAEQLFAPSHMKIYKPHGFRHCDPSILNCVRQCVVPSAVRADVSSTWLHSVQVMAGCVPVDSARWPVDKRTTGTRHGSEPRRMCSEKMGDCRHSRLALCSAVWCSASSGEIANP